MLTIDDVGGICVLSGRFSSPLMSRLTGNLEGCAEIDARFHGQAGPAGGPFVARGAVGGN